jgi:hypothetical protein
VLSNVLFAPEFTKNIISVARLTSNGNSVSFTDVKLHGVIGHRQVTDGYLAQLARTNRGRLATFDGGLVALHPDIAELVPTTR